MKRLILLLLLLLVSVFSGGAQPFSEKHHLKGHPMRVATKRFTAIDKFGDITKGDAVDANKIEVFDRNGNLTEESEYDTLGSVRKRTLMGYDDYNRLTQRRHAFGFPFNYDPSATIDRRKPQPLNTVWNYRYAMDVDGRIKYIISEYVEGLNNSRILLSSTDSSKIDYLKGGLMLKKTYLNSNQQSGDLTVGNVHLQLYDKNGLILLYSSGTEIYRDLRPSAPEKDRSRRISAEELEAFSVSRPIRGGLIRFDTTASTSYIYDAGLLRKQFVRYYYEPMLTVVTNFKYNSVGDLMEEVCEGGSTPYFRTYRYLLYDGFGNWISKVEYENGVATYFYTRDIKYY
jgi:hypothetical protein